jgi:hypothetical protein
MGEILVLIVEVGTRTFEYADLCGILLKNRTWDEEDMQHT